MMAPAIRNWFGRGGGVTMPPVAPTDISAVNKTPSFSAGIITETSSRWPTERMDVVDALWGEGFLFPGGALETMRLAKPLGLSAASSLLLLGAGAGGPACTVATKVGVWVAGFEVDPDLVNAASERIIRSKLGRRAQVETWNPAEPEFTPRYYHHGLALEPLRGSAPEPTLAAIASALKPGGQLSMVELVATAPLELSDPTVARWSQLENRDPATLPSEVTITRVLGRLGFDVRIVEDISQRHMQQALLGWRTSVRGMEDEKPSPRMAQQLIGEAELWLMRLRLFRSGRLRMVRWYAIGRGG